MTVIRTERLRDLPGMRPVSRETTVTIALKMGKATAQFPQLARQAARRAVVARSWSIR